MVIGMRKSNRWLGLLGAAVILSSAGVLATTSDVFENCDAAESMGNGFCEQWANNEECGTSCIPIMRYSSCLAVVTCTISPSQLL